MARITGSFSNNNLNVGIYIDYTYTQNITNNTTTITAKLYVSRKRSYATTHKNNTPCEIKIGGSSVYSKTQSVNVGALSVGSSLLIGTASKTITHNSDGTASVNIYGKVDLSGTNPGTGTVNSTISLPTIPRKTTVSVSGTKKFGSSVTINHAGASSSFTHNIKYYLGNASGTIGTGRTGTSTSWSIPKTLQSQIPNTSSGTIKIVLETVSGGQVIGSSEATFSASISDDAVPSISGATFSDTMSKPSGVTGYYQNYSKLKAVINAAGVYGSTIKTYRVTVGGHTDVTSTSNSVTTGTLLFNGTFNITVHVTDSRGRAASKTYSNHLVVTAYTPPTVDSFSYKRMELVDGVESPSNMGTIGYISFTRTFHSASTSKAIRFLYKTKSATSWTAITLADQNYTNYKFSSTLSSADAYILRVELKDMLSTVIKDIEMVNIFPLISMNTKGDGVAFGKESTISNLIEFDIKTSFEKTLDVHDYLYFFKPNDRTIKSSMGIDAESGDVFMSNTSGNWLRLKSDKTMTYAGYQIYNSSNWSTSKANNGYCQLPTGVIIQWGKVVVTPVVNSNAEKTVVFPKAFPNACFSVTATPTTSVPKSVSVGASNISKTQFKAYLYRTDSTDTGINWFAIGY